LLALIGVARPDPLRGANGFANATAVGLLIPLCASILPIKNALNTNLHDAIDVDHQTGPQMVEYQIERSDQSSLPTTVLLVGITGVVFGFCVYYLFPLALITQRLSLLLLMFFSLMISMLIGLLILSFNVQHLIEEALAMVLFQWWESRVLSHVVRKNMIAHKHRNQKTTIMYGASLGFIIMIAVVYRVQINSLGLQILTSYGGKLFVDFGHRDHEISRYGEMESLFNDSISGLTFQYRARSALAANHELHLFDFSKIHDAGHLHLDAVAPDYLEVAERDLFAFASKNVVERIDQHLYSAAGSQGGILGFMARQRLQLNDDVDREVARKLIVQFPGRTFKVAQTLEYSEVFPGIGELSKLRSKQSALGLSLSSLVRWQEFADSGARRRVAVSAEDLQSLIKGALLSLRSDAAPDDVQRLKQYINEYSRSSFDFDDFSETMQSTNDVMDIVFSTATSVALFLCLFSVISSMYVNIYEQSKEVAVLRAIGLSKFQTYKVYLYEATILILTSCFMGIGVGALVGFTITAQIGIYASYPVGFDMPTTLLWQILGASFVSAMLSVILPLVQVLSKTVSHVMRVNF